MTFAYQIQTGDLRFDYFDMNYNHLDLINNWHRQADSSPHKPVQFDEMQKLESRLSQGIPHVRVDFYEVDGKIYFGESTFFDMGGFLKIRSNQWEKEWGELITLPIP